MGNVELPLAKGNSEKVGIVYGITSYLLWGILPIYWKMLKEVPAEQILAHRIVWSFLFVGIVLFFTGRWSKFRQVFSHKASLLVIALNGIILSGNWFTYIWAVNHDRVIEASLGYYINPLLTILLGSVVLKERHNFWQWWAVVLAGIGVGIMTFKFGRIPMVALVLAVSFAVYGLLKKTVPVDSLVGLALETFVVAPIAVGYMVFVETQGMGVLGAVTGKEFALLAGTGIVTALPLIFFGFASQRISLSTLGFIQFLSPTLSLLLGVFAFREAFTATHAVSFLFIWGAVILYSLAGTRWLSWPPKLFWAKGKKV